MGDPKPGQLKREGCLEFGSWIASWRNIGRDFHFPRRTYVRSSSPSSPTTYMVTSSTMVIREVTGSHVLTIDGYSLSKGAEHGKYFSSTFTAAGDRWLLRYYPRSGYGSGWTAMYLQLAPSNAWHVTARFTISLLDWNGEAVPSCTHAITRAHTFGP
ncbi:hypothetical protein HU200_007961 [Digitaria exilis]|uniref:MATH domain-containing protein n=1 Tax=Digitaria exilis TaxID=1010633 RepID=A0A835FMA7_9POAL|nr:hypothetical protein HU200_007961 [Digitaria exilis]